MQITAQIIADILNGELIGDPKSVISGPGKIEDAKDGDITFLGNLKYKDYIYDTKASVVLVNRDFSPEKSIHTTLIKVDNVYGALAILMEKFNTTISINDGIASTAVVHSTVNLGQGVKIDDYVIIKKNVDIGNNTIVYGQVFIGDNVKIGQNSIIYPGVKIYHNCIIGDNCIIHANTVIGSDGFGFATDEQGNYKKIPQTGNVIIENNVEIGSNTVIDRASMGSTLIRQGAKLDNLIQIAHNVIIGNNTALAAQVGVAGSTQIGNNCLVGGQVGIVGHLKIADGTMIQAQSGVASSVKQANSKLYGTPAIDYPNYLKSFAYFKKLPELVQEIRALKMELDKIKNNR